MGTFKWDGCVELIELLRGLNMEDIPPLDDLPLVLRQTVVVCSGLIFKPREGVPIILTVLKVGVS